MPAFNFARGNMGAGLLGGLFGGPVGILAAMFGGRGLKNRRRAKEATRIAEIEKAEDYLANNRKQFSNDDLLAEAEKLIKQNDKN